MAQSVMEVIFHQPLTVYNNILEGKPVHLPKHTALSIALLSPAHVMIARPASRGVAEVQNWKKNRNEVNPGTESVKKWEDEACAS